MFGLWGEFQSTFLICRGGGGGQMGGPFCASSKGLTINL